MKTKSLYKKNRIKKKKNKTKSHSDSIKKIEIKKKIITDTKSMFSTFASDLSLAW